MQLFVWIVCERSHASFAQARRKHKLPCREEKQGTAGCLRRNIVPFCASSNQHALLAATIPAAKNPEA
jgi:hypothetical protein